VLAALLGRHISFLLPPLPAFRRRFIATGGFSIVAYTTRSPGIFFEKLE
jgi:hypothetical protein